MTRSVTIVNTSNWSGENLTIRFHDPKRPEDGQNSVVLKAGEMFKLPHHEFVVEFNRDAPHAPNMITDNKNRQIYPKVEVNWTRFKQ